MQAIEVIACTHPEVAEQNRRNFTHHTHDVFVLVRVVREPRCFTDCYDITTEIPTSNKPTIGHFVLLVIHTDTAVLRHFVRDYPGGPIQVETFTHLHLKHVVGVYHHSGFYEACGRY